MRTVTKMFKKSPTKAELLYKNEEKGNRSLRLILDCKTRWSSLAHMIARFLVLKNSVMKALIDLKSNIIFTEDDLQQLEDISDSLNIIKATLESICQQDANLLTAEIALKFMIEKLSLKNNHISLDLLQALKERISQRRLSVINGTLKYLHNPNNFYNEISSFPFQNPDNETVRDYIVKFYTMHTQSPSQQAGSVTVQILPKTQSEVNPVPFSIKEQLQMEIERSLSTSTDTSASSSELDIETQIKVEMALYDSGGKRPENLERVYNALLTIPPTSVEADRVFSASGYLCNHLRTSLKPDSIDALSFLRSYYQGFTKK